MDCNGLSGWLRLLLHDQSFLRFLSLIGYRRLLRISPFAHTASIVRKTITPLPVPLIADEAEAKEQHIRYTEHYHGNGELYESIGNGIWFLAVSLSHVELLYRNLPTLWWASFAYRG